MTGKRRRRPSKVSQCLEIIRWGLIHEAHQFQNTRVPFGGIRENLPALSSSGCNVQETVYFHHCQSISVAEWQGNMPGPKHNVSRPLCLLEVLVDNSPVHINEQGFTGADADSISCSLQTKSCTRGLICLARDTTRCGQRKQYVRYRDRAENITRSISMESKSPSPLIQKQRGEMGTGCAPRN